MTVLSTITHVQRQTDKAQDFFYKELWVLYLSFNTTIDIQMMKH